jgi:hypothetical protein
LFIYFGGESLENPDLRIDLTVVPDDSSVTIYKWDVLYASISVSADGKTRGIAAMVYGQSTASGMFEWPIFVPFDGRTALPAVHGDAGGYEIGSDVPVTESYLAFVRDTRQSLPAHEFVFGGLGVIFTESAPLDVDHPAQQVGFHTGAEFVHEAIELPPTGDHEDLLLVTDSAVFRTTGDIDAALSRGGDAAEYPVGAGVPIRESAHRFARGRAGADGHFYAIANSETDTEVAIIDVPATGDPVAYELTTTSSADDLAIANVGGSDAIDAVVLQSGTLGVYRDLPLTTPGAVSPAATIGSRDELAGYDILAVGNFHGSDQLEIYATSDLHPESRLVCYHLNDQLDPCADE